MKTIKSDNARLYFTLVHNQFLNGMIPSDVYIERLVKLKSLIAKQTALYRILQDILSTIPTEQFSKSKDRQPCFLGNQWEIIYDIANREDGLLKFTTNFRVADNDKFPSCPHIHDDENHRKIDVFTGICNDDTQLSDKDLVDLWNDAKFIKKIKKNRKALEKR